LITHEIILSRSAARPRSGRRGHSRQTHACASTCRSRFWTRVLDIRRGQHDDFWSALPAEITVAGSGGVGEFESVDDPRQAFATLDEIGRSTPPIEAEFDQVRRFPGTDIFYFSVRDEAPICALDVRIVASGIRFKPPLHSFTPHCTLRSRSPVTETEADYLLNLQLPGTFTLDVMVVYSMPPPMPILHRSSLSGRA